LTKKDGFYKQFGYVFSSHTYHSNITFWCFSANWWMDGWWTSDGNVA